MVGARRDLVADLLAYLDRSPTPYHAVEESVRRLAAVGYRAFSDSDVWDLTPGDRGTLVRNDGSLVAFEVGSASPAAAGFRIVGAHTDSPNLRLKPRADVDAHGYRQLAVEPYGGVLLHTWLDRDLSLAGRVILGDGGGTRSLLLDFARPLLRVPNLAIHLQRELRSEGLKLNAQQHLVPVVGLEGAPTIATLIAGELRAQGAPDIAPEEVLAFDLMTYDVQSAAVTGAEGEFISASRLDNLASCHAAVTALADCDSLAEFTRVVVLYDHEEVGSRSAEGAAGPLLADAIERIASGFKGRRAPRNRSGHRPFDPDLRGHGTCRSPQLPGSTRAGPLSTDREGAGHQGERRKRLRERCAHGRLLRRAVRPVRCGAAVLRLAQRRRLRIDDRADQRRTGRGPNSGRRKSDALDALVSRNGGYGRCGAYDRGTAELHGRGLK